MRFPYRALRGAAAAAMIRAAAVCPVSSAACPRHEQQVTSITMAFAGTYLRRLSLQRRKTVTARVAFSDLVLQPQAWRKMVYISANVCCK